MLIIQFYYTDCSGFYIYILILALYTTINTNYHSIVNVPVLHGRRLDEPLTFGVGLVFIIIILFIQYMQRCFQSKL